MAIKIKERFFVDDDGNFDLFQVENQIKQLLTGEYAIYVCDSKREKTLQQYRYLFGVVFKMIGAELCLEPKDLYKIFEKKFAPQKVVDFMGEEKIVQDFKSCNSKEQGKVIEEIIRWADVEINVRIPTQDELREPVAQEAYVGAYNDTWVKK